MNWLGAGCCAASLAAAVGYLLGGSPAMPDPHLTLGAVRSTSITEICSPGYAHAHRVWGADPLDKASTLAKYGLPRRDRRLYEDDDLVPVCLGGDNADPRNHWPQLWAEARRKDALEWAACRAVCRTGSQSDLQRLQRAFATDWVSVERLLP